MTFHDFLHDLFKFSKTIGLATSFKKSKTFLVLDYFLTLNSSTGTNSGVNQNACCLRCLISPLYLYIVLALSSAVTNLSHKTLIFHDFQGPTIKFHDFPGLENEILNSMTFQVFHDLYEPCLRNCAVTHCSYYRHKCQLNSGMSSLGSITNQPSCFNTVYC